MKKTISLLLICPLLFSSCGSGFNYNSSVDSKISTTSSQLEISSTIEKVESIYSSEMLTKESSLLEAQEIFREVKIIVPKSTEGGGENGTYFIAKVQIPEKWDQFVGDIQINDSTDFNAQEAMYNTQFFSFNGEIVWEIGGARYIESPYIDEPFEQSDPSINGYYDTIEMIQISGQNYRRSIGQIMYPPKISSVPPDNIRTYAYLYEFVVQDCLAFTQFYATGEDNILQKRIQEEILGSIQWVS